VAAQPVQAMLAHPDRDRRELANLVALRRGCLDALLLAEGARARAAALRPVLDELVHPLERKQGAVPAWITGLATPPSTRARLARARRRRGRILGGRKRGVARVAVEPLLELGDAGLKPPVRLDQLAHLHEQGDRRFAVAVENCLRFSTLHAARVRRAEAGPFLLENHKTAYLRRSTGDPSTRPQQLRGR
jgi:hypothetical protein